MDLQGGIYLLYLWWDVPPSRHTDASLQREHTAGWGVGSLFLGADAGASPSRSNGLFSKSLFCSLENWRERKSSVIILSLCWYQQHRGGGGRAGDGGWAFISGTNWSFSLQKNGTSALPDTHLQHSWNVLSGLPSDSERWWTISQRVEPSTSEVNINTCSTWRE